MSVSQRYQSLKEATQLSLNEVEGFDLLVEQLLSKVVLETIRTYQTKLAVGIEDSAADLLDTFKRSVIQQIFETASGWRISHNDCFVLPRGCRFCFRKGKSTIFVIEQDPQIRTISMLMDVNENLVRPYNNLGTAVVKRFSLAMPYSVFVIRITDNGIVDTRYYWNIRPLQRMSDDLLEATLPNIHVGGQVCMGQPTISENKSVMCDEITSTFWNSQFNGDLSKGWDDKERLGIWSATDWQTKSTQNLFFLLPLAHKVVKPLREITDSFQSDDELPNESQFRHKLEEEIEKCSERLFHKITAYIKKTKFEKHCPKDIKDLVREQFRGATSELTDTVIALQNEVNSFSVDNELDMKIVPVGIFWEGR